MLLYQFTTTYVVEGVSPEDVQPEIKDTRQQIHTTSETYTAGTNNSSFFNSMSTLLRLFKYVCPVIYVLHI